MSVAWVNSWRRRISCGNMISLRCLPVFLRNHHVKCRFVFTCPDKALVSGVCVDVHAGKQGFHKLGLTPLLLSQGSTEPFGQLSVLVIQAMGLCAGFAAADFKPICWGKIGLVYQPRFIVHILFVNPTNYVYFPIAIALYIFFFFLVNLFSFFCPHKHRQQAKTKDNTAARGQQIPGVAAPGYKMQDHSRNAGKGTALCSERESHETLRGRSYGMRNSRQSHSIVRYHNTPASFSLTFKDYDHLPTSFEPEEWV